ncbi:hypothetical protein CBOM_03217 [Ceraceosorus bombacis]|uniref:Secreted protein n=1 Tax=Ceraceosorus bombacis TaxID=401625 RepID=A0A0P1BN42_9BASI|nr:hypothetical protein CBOM_03217 [Ceraceosorus bombacis]
MIARISSLALAASVFAATSSLVSAQPFERRAGFSCEKPGAPVWLSEGDASYGSGGLLLGTFGNPDDSHASSPAVIGIDGRTGPVTPFQVQVTRCTFDGIRASLKEGGTQPSGVPNDHAVKLQVVGRKNKCVALADLTKANTRLQEVDCSSVNTAASQEPQFFVQHYKYGNLRPYGTGNKSYSFYIEDSPTGAIIANPEGCFDGQTCQTDNAVSLL